MLKRFFMIVRLTEWIGEIWGNLLLLVYFGRSYTFFEKDVISSTCHHGVEI